ncbi:hypothetical protein [Pelotomaculum propionicicum]|uniref:hypothetical protein n=1 Tax=Pelotomaculum propionicicum TaxID=258475 RepID=UPI003BA0BF8D
MKQFLCAKSDYASVDLILFHYIQMDQPLKAVKKKESPDTSHYDSCLMCKFGDSIFFVGKAGIRVQKEKYFCVEVIQ